MCSNPVPPCTMAGMTTWGPFIAGLAAFGAAGIAFFAAALGRKQSDAHIARSHELERVRALRDRYTEIATQLASPATTVRLAGVYGLAGLADDWHRFDNDDERRVCINLLCSYLRTSREDQGDDHEVRAAIVGEIRKRTQRDDITNRESWRKIPLDLRGADLTRTDLSGADLRDANLAGAHIDNTNFSQADLTKVDMAEAKGNADMGWASMHGTRMNKADMPKAFLMSADLTEANLTGAVLTEAVIHDTNLYRATLNGADLSGAEGAHANTTKIRTDEKTRLPARWPTSKPV